MIDWDNLIKASDFFGGTITYDWTYEAADRANAKIREILKDAPVVYWYKTFDGWYDKKIEKTHRRSLGDEKPTHSAQLINVRELSK